GWLIATAVSSSIAELISLPEIRLRDIVFYLLVDGSEAETRIGSNDRSGATRISTWLVTHLSRHRSSQACCLNHRKACCRGPCCVPRFVIKFLGGSALPPMLTIADGSHGSLGR